MAAILAHSVQLEGLPQTTRTPSTRLISRAQWGSPQTMTTDGFLAVRNGNLPLLKHLIAEKKTSLTHTRWSGMTLLHRAADVAQVDIIKYLMEIGADASAKTFRGGDTPLHLAVSAGHEKAVLACVEIKFTARSS